MAKPVGSRAFDSQQLDVSREALHVSWLALYLSVLQAMIGVGGIIFVWLTLKETRNAVKESATAASAAVQAVNHARAVSKLELSAYVNLDAITEDKPKNQASKKSRTLGFKFSNIGATPAYDVTLQFDWLSIVKGNDIPDDFDFESIKPRVPAIGITPFNSKITLSPGKQQIWDVTLNEEEEAKLNSYRELGSRVFVYGMFSYRNIFGTVLQAPFCLGYEPDEEHPDRCPFVFSDRNNSALPPFADFES